MASPTAPDASFTPDVPGTYEFGLQVSDDAGSTSDDVVIQAAPSQWLVPVDTMVGEPDQPGIQVGDMPYPAPGDAHSCFVQPEIPRQPRRPV